jgi:hypothetical protein
VLTATQVTEIEMLVVQLGAWLSETDRVSVCAPAEAQT